MSKNPFRRRRPKRHPNVVIGSPGKAIVLSDRPGDGWDDCLDEDDIAAPGPLAADKDIFDLEPGPAIKRLIAPKGISMNSQVGPRGKYDPRKHRIGPPPQRRKPHGRRQRTRQNAPSYPALPRLSADSAPEKSDKEIKTLWGCTTVAEVHALSKKWNKKFGRKVLGAVKRRKLPDEMKAMIGRLLSHEATTVPIMTNPKVRRTAFKRLHDELVAAVQTNPGLEVALVTFISGAWATSHSKPFIELHHSQKAMDTTLRAMAPHFLCVTELSLFNSHSHPGGGQVVQVHGHALIWGEGVHLKAQKVAVTHISKFTPNITEAPQLDVRRVDTDEVNLARVCAYLFKPPYRAMTWCPPREGKRGHMHQSEKGDRFTRYLRMAELYSLLTFEDVCFGGKDGNTIKGKIRDFLRQMCDNDAGGARRPIHPDGVASFWNEVARALGMTKWALPIIARRP